MTESAEDAARRWQDLFALQQHYADFTTFLDDVNTEVLGFKCTRIHKDIGNFLATGPNYLMVQAQRGQAKTTTTAIYAVWCLIHDPSTRILIVSAGGTMASQIAFSIINIIKGMPELECLRPDTALGDRSSILAFDVHRTLKGIDKSPSVACRGITSVMQGFRADLLIADDVECQENSATAIQREKLLELTRDFPSICSTGRIIYLGTPQSVDSIYNTLPAAGFDIRIYPGRYPTEAELPNYQGNLAPILLNDIAENPSLQTGGGRLCDKGQPTDPVMLNEEALCKKELAQGAAYFKLQHMLDTRLLDADKYPLKLSDIIFMPVPISMTSLDIRWSKTETAVIPTPTSLNIKDKLYRGYEQGNGVTAFSGTLMYIDPAGGGSNGDELAWSVTRMLAGRVYVVECTGIKGGYGDEQVDRVIQAVLKHRVPSVKIEKNFGNGAFAHILTPRLIAATREAGFNCSIEEVWESGQKELRIIDTLEPMISSHRLVMDEDIIRTDYESIQHYPTAKRNSYSLLHQIAKITRDKGSLVHDDRLDALAGGCRHWSLALSLDAQKIAQEQARDLLLHKADDFKKHNLTSSSIRNKSYVSCVSKYLRKYEA